MCVLGGHAYLGGFAFRHKVSSRYQHFSTIHRRQDYFLIPLKPNKKDTSTRFSTMLDYRARPVLNYLFYSMNMISHVRLASVCFPCFTIHKDNSCLQHLLVWNLCNYSQFTQKKKTFHIKRFHVSNGEWKIYSLLM